MELKESDVDGKGGEELVMIIHRCCTREEDDHLCRDRTVGEKCNECS